MSEITNPKLPKWFIDRALQAGDLIERFDGHIYKIYTIQGKIIWLHEPSITEPSYFQLTAITINELKNYTLCQK